MLKPLLLLLPWLLLSLSPGVARAFPIQVPEFGEDGEVVLSAPIDDIFPIGVVTLNPDLQIGDTVTWPFVLPSRHDSSTDFSSYNREMPQWLSASNEVALPMPIIGGESTEHAIIYTVITQPPARTEAIAFEVFGRSVDQTSLGPGDTRVLLVKCVEF